VDVHKNVHRNVHRWNFSRFLVAWTAIAAPVKVGGAEGPAAKVSSEQGPPQDSGEQPSDNFA
jgi:hypothetical protein